MKENIIKFVTEDEDTLYTFPPVPATKIVPDWYKEIPVSLEKAEPYVTHDNIPSIKRCVPVLDYQTSGYVLKNSYEIIAKFYEKDDIRSFSLDCNKDEYVGAHPWHQSPTKIYGKKNHYFKINQQWLIRTPPGYSCLIYQPQYLFNEKYKMLPAIVDTDKHNDFIGLIGVSKTDKDFTIEAGEPLVIIFPFKRENWKMEASFDVNVAKNSSFKYYLQGVWHGFYQKHFHSKKSYK